jgi:fibronectin type 3 domain-containing protein
LIGKDSKFGSRRGWVHLLTGASRKSLRRKAAAVATCLVLGAGLVQATNKPTHAAAGPSIERLDLLTSSAATGDAGNSWGGHKTRIVSTSKGDTYTVFQGAGSGYTSHQWVVMHYSAASGTWSQAGAGNAGREPANILRGPDDTIYVIAWPGGMPAMWTSADGFASQENIPGNWLQNDWPYAGAGIDGAGNIYLIQTNSNDEKPGQMYYSERNASSGQWSPVETTNSDMRSTYSFALPGGNGFDIIASADVQWKTMGWSVPSNPMNSTYVWPEVNLFHSGSASQSASESTIHSETQSSQYTNVNVYGQDAYTDNQGRIHLLYDVLGPSTQDQYTVRHAVIQNGQVVKDVPLNMYDVADARITQDSTGQYYFITDDNTCVCLLVYPADSVDGTTLQGGYASLPLNGYHPKDWLFLGSPRAGSPLSDEIDFAFPGDNAEQWVSGRLRLRDSGTVTPTPSVSPSATITATAAAGLSAPTNLAGGYNNGAMSLTWNAASGASGYNVYRGFTNGNETLYKSGVSSASFSDSSLQAGIDYWYKVTAVNAGGESAASNEVITYTPSNFTPLASASPSASATASPSASATPSPTATATPAPAAPAAPTSLSGGYNNGGMSLSWSGSSGATSYSVYRGLNNGSETLYKSGVSSTSFRDTSLQAGTDYWYKVTASDSAGQSAASNEIITYTPSISKPAAPSGLQATFSSGGNNLSWTASSTANVTYNVYRGWVPGGESLYKTGITSTSFRDTQNLQRGMDYWYKVTAVNSAGQSGASNEAITYVR